MGCSASSANGSVGQAANGRTNVFHGPGRFNIQMLESGECVVRSLQSCNWIAAMRPDPRFWFSMPPLRNRCAGIQVQMTVRDQGAGNRAGALHLLLIRQGRPVVPRLALVMAEHNLTTYDFFIPETEPIVQSSQPGDLYLVQRTIGGPYGCGHELHVERFVLTFMSFPEFPCYSRAQYFKAKNYLDYGDWGTYGNIGHPRDNGDVKFDLDRSWLDFGAFLQYPASMLLSGGGTSGRGKAPPQPQSQPQRQPQPVVHQRMQQVMPRGVPQGAQQGQYQRQPRYPAMPGNVPRRQNGPDHSDTDDRADRADDKNLASDGDVDPDLGLHETGIDETGIDETGVLDDSGPIFYFEDDGTGGYDGGAGEQDVMGGGGGADGHWSGMDGGGDGGWGGGGDGGWGGGGDGGWGGGGDGGWGGGGGDGGGGGGGGDGGWGGGGGDSGGGGGGGGDGGWGGGGGDGGGGGGGDYGGGGGDGGGGGGGGYEE
eukprot:gene32157-38897_t